MAPVLSALLLLGGIALIIGLFAVGAYVMDSRTEGKKVKLKQLAQAQKALSQVEDLARDTLLVNPSDITAHQVLDVVNKARRLP